MTRDILGRPVAEALSHLPLEEQEPRIVETAAPVRPGQERREGTLRVICCRGNEWIAARFWDHAPRKHKKEEP